MEPIPEVTLQNGELVGWFEFECWAAANILQWQHALMLSRHGKCTNEQAYKLVAYLLTKRCAKLHERVAVLELIAPKKMRFHDGSVRAYRCPDELVPFDESA